MRPIMTGRQSRSHADSEQALTTASSAAMTAAPPKVVPRLGSPVEMSTHAFQVSILFVPRVGQLSTAIVTTTLSGVLPPSSVDLR